VGVLVVEWGQYGFCEEVVAVEALVELVACTVFSILDHVFPFFLQAVSALGVLTSYRTNTSWARHKYSTNKKHYINKSKLGQCQKIVRPLPVFSSFNLKIRTKLKPTLQQQTLKRRRTVENTRVAVLSVLSEYLKKGRGVGAPAS
jgi:hypothetical protein